MTNDVCYHDHIELTFFVLSLLIKKVYIPIPFCTQNGDEQPRPSANSIALAARSVICTLVLVVAAWFQEL